MSEDQDASEISIGDYNLDDMSSDTSQEESLCTYPAYKQAERKQRD